MMISNVVLAIMILIVSLCVYFGVIITRDINSRIDELNTIVKWAEEELKSMESKSRIFVVKMKMRWMRQMI